jgi:hypothetical protein
VATLDGDRPVRSPARALGAPSNAIELIVVDANGQIVSRPRIPLIGQTTRTLERGLPGALSASVAPTAFARRLPTNAVQASALAELVECGTL